MYGLRVCQSRSTTDQPALGGAGDGRAEPARGARASSPLAVRLTLPVGQFRACAAGPPPKTWTATMINSRSGASQDGTVRFRQCEGAALFVALLLATAVLPTTVRAQTCSSTCDSCDYDMIRRGESAYFACSEGSGNGGRYCCSNCCGDQWQWNGVYVCHPESHSSCSSPPPSPGWDSIDWGNVPDMPGGLAATAGAISICLGIMLNLFGYKLWKCECHHKFIYPSVHPRAR